MLDKARDPRETSRAMTMNYRRLGKSGLQVSALSFGSWVTFGKQIGDPVAEKLLHTAYEAGVNFFDNAEAYAGGRSEQVMGDILQRAGWDRTSFLVSSKVFWGGDRPNQGGLSRKHVVEACHAALRRLQVEYLDLYYCHRPDPNTPIEETCRAMHDLITQGKVLYWGTSEWSAAQLKAAFLVCDQLNLHAPVVEQPQYSLLHRKRFEKELTPVFRSRGMGTTIWSPLASGLLTGKYNEGIPADSRLAQSDMAWLRKLLLEGAGRKRLAAITKLAAVAKELDTTLARLAIAWCLTNPQVSTVILGASKVEQLVENLGALEVLPRLTPAVGKKIDSLTRGVADLA